jgi:hypothetical protein
MNYINVGMHGESHSIISGVRLESLHWFRLANIIVHSSLRTLTFVPFMTITTYGTFNTFLQE